MPKAGRGISTPFVEVEVIGAPYDSHNKYKTGNNNDNGLNPTWNDVCEFDIINPDVALLRFVVQDEDMFGDPNFLGQASFPVRCLRTGEDTIKPTLSPVRTTCRNTNLVFRISCGAAVERPQ